ncbi:MAG: cation:proton antiporter [Chitinophagales bacterium]
MNRLSSNDVLPFLIILTILLLAARLTGEIFKRFRMPAVMGELFAGVVLGPTVLGTVFPQVYQSIFASPQSPAIAFDGVSRIGIILLLFVAGMEVNINSIRRRGKAAAKISIASVILPFAIGFVVAQLFFSTLFTTPATDHLVPSLFMGTTLCITALSVAAKILIDLDLIKTRFGNLILTAAMINDFIGWMLFVVVINLANLQHEVLGVVQTIVTVILFAVLLLTFGRRIIDKGFEFCERHLSKPGGSLSFAIIVCLLGAIFTEWVGIHAIFGAFLMGIAVGGCSNFKVPAREGLFHFITNIFAPLFFVSIGMRVNFITNFDWRIVSIVVAIACVGKIVGGTVGAKLSGFKTNKAYAVGFAMNARGSMEIVLGLLALQAKIIDERIFVALVVMTFVTIMMAGPAIKFFLRRHEVALEKESANREAVSVTPAMNSIIRPNPQS